MTKLDPQTFARIARAQRLALAGDPFRPLVHFVAPSGWLNDPNGLICWQGAYHLFYQHNPFHAGDGRKHWGHAVSPDLVHWEDLPVALTPGVGEPDPNIYQPGQVERPADFTILPGQLTPDEIDSEGAWSGCAVDDHGTPTLVYTARPGLPEWVCLATSQDGLLTWRKDPANPVLTEPPPGLAVSGFRDPYVWQEGEGWAMALGSGDSQGPRILLYRSPDLRRWSYAGPLFEGSVSRYGVMWECPNFISLGQKHALLTAGGILAIARYYVGNYDGTRLLAEKEGLVDYGADFYAPQVFSGTGDRRILMGWAWESRSEQVQLEAGWAGVLTLPRQLFLGPDGELASRPAPEVDALRGRALETPAGSCQDIEVEFEPGAGEVGLCVLAGPDGREETRIGYRPGPEGGRVFIDRTRSSLFADAARSHSEGPLHLAPGERVRLRILIDRSILEVCANERVCLTTRVYPSRPDSSGVRPFGAVPVRLQAWELEPVEFGR